MVTGVCGGGNALARAHLPPTSVRAGDGPSAAAGCAGLRAERPLPTGDAALGLLAAALALLVLTLALEAVPSPASPADDAPALEALALADSAVRVSRSCSRSWPSSSSSCRCRPSKKAKSRLRGPAEFFSSDAVAIAAAQRRPFSGPTMTRPRR